MAYVWLMNPLSQTLEIYRWEGGRFVLLDIHEGDDVVRAEPFDAVELALAALWAS